MQNRFAMRPEVRAEFERAAADLGGDGAFQVRLERHFTELRDPLNALYGHDQRFGEQWQRLLRAIANTAKARSPELRLLDHEREITPDWLQREQTLGYVTYVDRFNHTLQGLNERLGYLKELGITYLHLMPLLKARPEPNDGGYAVTDYGAVDPKLGTMEDLTRLATELRQAGIALCVDVVVNHTAKEHAWAREALARYRTYPDREEPDAYERTLPEVFPDTAPGNFTWVPELGRWVWTTFNAYQWDLDYTNPDVFVAMTEVMLNLANQGIDVLRLDAVPFLWKRQGTNGQNQPEAHQLLHAFRAALRIAAPAVAFKAEAIVSPADLVRYLDSCDLAYHNSLMVLLWSALASGKVALMTSTLRRMPPKPPHAGWVTYVRCHDDIGWAVTEQDAAAVGEDGYLHRRFLSDFYAGDFPGSFARGARFQPDPRSGEARTSGMTASLAGLGTQDEELAIRRILLLHAITFAFGGVPLLYMGDEVGLRNDAAWAADPAHSDDNRWMHRPPMDWEAAERRRDPASAEGRIWAGLQRLAQARRATPAVHAQGVAEPIWTGNEHVFGLCREHAGARLLVLANFTAAPQPLHLAPVHERGLTLAPEAADPDGRPLAVDGDYLVLAPYQHIWVLD